LLYCQVGAGRTQLPGWLAGRWGLNLLNNFMSRLYIYMAFIKIIVCYYYKGKSLLILEVTDSREKISEIYPEFKKINKSLFNKKWTYLQLRKLIKSYLLLGI
jgi:hypothetical protein